jgi:deazaflavin-dependent oxidoreductase (nitroreductase family)
MKHHPSMRVKEKKGYALLVERIYLLGQYLTIRLVPKDGPGRIASWLFRIPLHMYRIGLGRWIENKILLLTTIGRRSGKPRTVPLGYIAGIENGVYYIIAGWRGGTDWYKNLVANSMVLVAVGSTKFKCQAQQLSTEDHVQVLSNYSRQFPFVIRSFVRLTGMEKDDPEAFFRKVSEEGPMILLRDTKDARAVTRENPVA